jgi:hypothetical protein
MILCLAMNKSARTLPSLATGPPKDDFFGPTIFLSGFCQLIRSEIEERGHHWL